jgi:hypothetical protein
MLCCGLEDVAGIDEQVVLAIPERPETNPFFGLARSRGFATRRLRRCARPDLATPVSVWQLAPVLAADEPPDRPAPDASPSKRCRVRACDQERIAYLVKVAGM